MIQQMFSEHQVGSYRLALVVVCLVSVIRMERETREIENKAASLKFRFSLCVSMSVCLSHLDMLCSLAGAINMSR